MDELIIAPFLRKERGFLLRSGTPGGFIPIHIIIIDAACGGVNALRESQLSIKLGVLSPYVSIMANGAFE